MNEELVQKAADTAAAGSVGMAGVAWLADIEPVLTALAALVAIGAGIIAAWYHYERATFMRRKNSDDKLERMAQELAEEAIKVVEDEAE